MNTFRRPVLALLMMAFAAPAAAQDEESRVRAADDRFWNAYNACDMEAMADLITDDVEFYHDRTGLTVSREALIASLRKGPCGSPGMHLRREAVEGSLAFRPLKGGYAIVSGTHRFHVQETGKPEHLDGQAEFTSVWKLDGGRWRMHRVLSYDHGPVPYSPPSASLTLPPSTLAAYAGRYRSARIGEILVAVEGDHLRLTAGDFVATLRPETQTRFFAVERDLRFEFEAGGSGGIEALAVYENGAVSERAPRVGKD